VQRMSEVVEPNADSSGARRGRSDPRAVFDGSREGQTLRYSSPAPWIAAIILSLTLWAIVAWSIWRLFQ
jgi:hypothetical protein